MHKAPLKKGNKQKHGHNFGTNKKKKKKKSVPKKKTTPNKMLCLGMVQGVSVGGKQFLLMKRITLYSFTDKNDPFNLV